jgi:hypothetical protein
MSIIGKMLEVNVYNRARFYNQKYYYSYYLVSSTIRSKKFLRHYLSLYPLYSSKALDYYDWCKIVDISSNPPLSKEQITLCQNLKKGMNKSRIHFSWDHLKNLKI